MALHRSPRWSLANRKPEGRTTGYRQCGDGYGPNEGQGSSRSQNDSGLFSGEWREGLNELHLFAGAGGGILGGMLLGHTPVCAVEVLPFRRQIILQRQRDGILPWFPIWDDIRTFDAMPWRGCVDVVCGGFPCQDISCASSTRDGLEGERSGLWKEMARVICEVGPRFVFVENSPVLVIRGLGTILSNLAEMGFNAKWGVFSARDCGAPIKRERLFIAGSNQINGEQRVGIEQNWSKKIQFKGNRECPEFWLQTPPVSFGMEHGMDSYMDQVGAIGDGQVPSVVKLAWEILSEGLK